jgi:flagellar FliL protein
MAEPNPADAPVEGATPAPKKSRKLLYILAGLVVVLLGGGAGAWFMLQPAGKDEHAAKAAHAEPIYIAFDPPFVVNFESNGLVRFLQVTVQAETGDPLAADVVKKHDPVIRNDLLMLFSGQTYETLSTRAGKEKLRQAALAEVRRVVAAQGGKADDVRNLYFTSFVMQ